MVVRAIIVSLNSLESSSSTIPPLPSPKIAEMIKIGKARAPKTRCKGKLVTELLNDAKNEIRAIMSCAREYVKKVIAVASNRKLNFLACTVGHAYAVSHATAAESPSQILSKTNVDPRAPKPNRSFSDRNGVSSTTLDFGPTDKQNPEKSPQNRFLGLPITKRGGLNRASTVELDKGVPNLA